MEEKVDVFFDYHSRQISVKYWTYEVNAVMQPTTHIAKPLAPEPSTFRVEGNIEKFEP
jgi:hypothetical protein